MNDKMVNLFNEFLITQMNHWILFTISVTILGLIGGNKPNMIVWVLLSIFPFLLYIIRLRSSKFIPFIILHIALTAWLLIFLSSETIMLLIYAAYLIGYMVNSIYIKIKSNDRIDNVISPIMAVSITSVMIMLQFYQGDKEWDVYYTSVLIIFLGMYFIHHYLERYLHFIRVNEESAGHLPKSEIFRSGMGTAAIYTVFCVAVLLLTADVAWLSKIVVQIKQVLIWLLRFFVKFIKTDSKTSTGSYEYQSKVMQDAEIIEQSEPFWLWDVLGYIFMVIIIALVIYIFVKNIIKLVRFLKVLFNSKYKVKGYVHQDTIDIREKCEIIRDKTSKKSFFAFLSPYERIRKIYKKKILEGKKVLIGEQDASLLNNMTARECGEQLMVEVLADVYEKARYSDQECTAEDVKTAKIQRLSKK